MPIIDLHKVVGVWEKEDIRNWTFGEKKELARRCIESMEYDYGRRR